MVWLVDVLVDAGMVLETVDPVDEEIGEEEIQRYAEHKVRPSVIRDVVVDHGMSSDLSQKPRKRHGVDPRNGNHRRLDLHPNLILQKPRVVLQPPVEKAEIADRAEQKVHRSSTDGRDDVERDALTDHRVSGQIRGRFEGRVICNRRIVRQGHAGVVELRQRGWGVGVREEVSVRLIQCVVVAKVENHVHLGGKVLRVSTGMRGPAWLNVLGRGR